MGQLKNFIDSLNSCAGIAVDNPNTKEGTAAFFYSLMEMKIEADDIQTVKTFDRRCHSAQKKFIKVQCDKYMTTNSFKNGTKETYGQAICCDELKFCSEPSEPFYTQIWFFAVCGGVGLLIIIAIIGVVYFFCIRKKRGGRKSSGGGSKSSESTSKKSRK